MMVLMIFVFCFEFQISGLRMIFLINVDLINAIRQESAKMNGPLN